MSAQWQPLATAPKAKAVLLFYSGSFYIGYWDDSHGCWYINEYGDYLYPDQAETALWMQLPPEPGK